MSGCLALRFERYDPCRQASIHGSCNASLSSHETCTHPLLDVGRYVCMYKIRYMASHARQPLRLASCRLSKCLLDRLHSQSSTNRCLGLYVFTPARCYMNFQRLRVHGADANSRLIRSGRDWRASKAAVYAGLGSVLMSLCALLACVLLLARAGVRESEGELS